MSRAPACRAEHPLFARLWPKIAGFAVPARRRIELLAGTSGRVLEIGAGDGASFAHYPLTVRELVAVEPEPLLRGAAHEAARSAQIEIEVLGGSAEALPLPDGSFDCVVCSLVLCSVEDQARCLAEARRVLRTGGELRFYEHVVSHRTSTRSLQAGLDRSGVWPRLGAGCHLARDTLGAIGAGGFDVMAIRRYYAGPSDLGVPFVLGTARARPASAPLAIDAAQRRRPAASGSA